MPVIRKNQLSRGFDLPRFGVSPLLASPLGLHM